MLWNCRRVLLRLLGLHQLEVDLELMQLRLRVVECELFSLRTPPQKPVPLRGQS